jgi:GH25 family lysozyme M1 (1,4-beta-N-acetylmuramidase)
MTDTPPICRLLSPTRLPSRLSICVVVALVWAARASAIDLVPGIDVSHHQGTINWSAVKNSGVKFAFTKATEGVNYVDPKYHANMQGATAAGVWIGPYHFCRIDSLNGVKFTSYDGSPFTPGTGPYIDAVSEAEDFLDAIRPYYQSGLYLPPVADVEGLPDFGSPSLNRTFISNWVQLFSDTVKNSLGVRPLIYTSKSGANSHYTSAVASSHDLWLAWWRGTGTSNPPVHSDTPLWNDWVFWQWTNSSSVAGISGNVDGDVFRGTLEDLTERLVGRDDSPNGDYNRDGAVDAADFTMWRDSLGANVPIYSGADGNGDSWITPADYGVWRANFGAGAGSGSASSSAFSLPPSLLSAAVPEPASLVLLLFQLAAATCIYRRRPADLCTD